MNEQNEMMAKALKEYMQMRADDIEEVVDALWVNQPDNLKAMKEYDDIEATLNNVFARNMPELHEQEELGMGFGKEEILNKVNYVDCENKELKEIWMDDELGKADPKVQKRIRDIMLTRKVKPKGETK